MIKAIIFDFARVFIFPKNKNYRGELNALSEILEDNYNYRFSDNFEFNNALLDFIKRERLDQRYDLYIFTSGLIQEEQECREFLAHFAKDVFSAKRLGLRKTDPYSYTFLSKQLGLLPENILFIDDSRENTIAAETAGVLTITFRNNMQFETEIEGYLA